jgi:hypothetical protein
MAGVLSVNDVRRDGEHRLRVNGVAIGRMLAELAHEHRNDRRSELIHAIIVITEHRELAFGFIIDNESGFVADHFHARITDSRQAVRND